MKCRPTVQSKTRAVILLVTALAITGCASSASSDIPPNDSAPRDTASGSSDTTTSTTIDPAVVAREEARQKLIDSAQSVVSSWGAVLEEAATLVKLPYKTSPGGQPIIYDNGCHLGWSTVRPRLCEFGDLTSDITIVVTGDSHAAHWFGAYEEAAKKWGWRLVMVTKRGCPAADVQVNKSTEDGTQAAPEAYKACDQWHVESQKFIRALKPDVVVFPMLTRRGVIGKSGDRAATEWREGLIRSIESVTKGTTTKVLVMSNTPKTIGAAIPSCLWGHTANIRPCVNKRSVAAAAKYADNLAEAARTANVGFVDVTPWICATKLCPAVVNKVMVYRDSHHLSDKFSRMLSNHVALEIDKLLHEPAAPAASTTSTTSMTTSTSTISAS